MIFNRKRQGNRIRSETGSICFSLIGVFTLFNQLRRTLTGGERTPRPDLVKPITPGILPGYQAMPHKHPASSFFHQWEQGFSSIEPTSTTESNC